MSLVDRMPKLARTPDEAALWMDRRPCERCRSVGFEREHQLREVDGELVAHYEGTCPKCGRLRTYDFALPATPTLTTSLSFGTGEPSQLFCPLDFIIIADDHAERVPAEVESLDEATKAAAVRDLTIAVAALEAAIDAIPEGASAIPRDANRPEVLRLYDQEPGRYERERLEAYRDRLKSML